jgi:hypothetical protein
MGCDIHLYKEKKVNGRWVTADEGWKNEFDEGGVDVPYDNRFTDRDYDLFGYLSKGVRREFDFSFLARGIPFNASEEVKKCSEQWGSDGHSHSYLTLTELKEAWEFLQTKTIPVDGMKSQDGFKELMESIESNEETDWDLIYPFCQGTTDRSYKRFSADVPATYKLGGVKRIIDLFEGINAEECRIVFWFDN